MRVFCISGYSNSGKTTLITEVIRAFSKRGYRVATVKSSKEDISPPEGSDTFRHLEAGAVTTVLLGPSSSMVRYTDRIDFTSFKKIDADYLLIEGMKESDIPKIWCIGTGAEKKEAMAPQTVAIVRWNRDEDLKAEKSDIPIFTQSDIVKIVEIIEKFSIEF